MKRFLNYGAALGCVSAVFVASCAHDDSTLFVLSVQAPPTGGAGQAGCLYKPDPAQPTLVSGTIDVEFLAAYRPFVLVGNQMIQQGRSEAFRTETSRITLQGATVTVEDAEGNQRASFTTLAAGFVNPSAGTVPGYGLVSVTLINPALVEKLREEIPIGETKRLLARFKVFGQTLGGQSIESNESQFPINACKGCLVDFPPEADDVTTPQVDCRVTGEATAIPQPCVKGQDELIDCRLCNTLDICDPNKRR